MASSKLEVVSASKGLQYCRAREIKAFDDSKAGVKGLLDAGVVEIPEFFVMPPEVVCNKNSDPDMQNLHIPVIDFKEMGKDGRRHKEIVNEIKAALQKWGFFQVVNHGIPHEVLDEMIEGVRRFNEQPLEVKQEFYSRDYSRKVRFNSNFDLYQAKAANWRDSLFCSMTPNPPDPEEFPATCREIILEYSKQVYYLGLTMFELLAEALGLNSNHLLDMDCAKGHFFVYHYYPACPQPDRALGTSRHCDPGFITILLQDQIGGLQVHYQDQWIDIHPMKEALVVNAGELLQLISNDKFKAADHRVLANQIGPRISVACFFSTHLQPFNKLYGPIKELLSDDNPPLYRDILLGDYTSYFHKKGLGEPVLPYLKL
ncbi:Isopenicillin N synthase-like, Fe(2+) 2OG dioxygenase domain [Dillenia turbinata]|uniref:Isopenicillin N synthase-like, Fe(2+) 2OG dioxygenase domain n=1 Tax=Dillenia turbinata TaxID=194707 RepID=A0AAN8YSS5_9MAGN